MQTAGPGQNEMPGRDRRTRRAVFAVGLLVLAGWFFASGVRPHVSPKRFGTVVEGRIYRSGELTPASLRLVDQRCDLKTIIDLGAFEPGSQDERIAQACADSLGVTRYRFDLEGDATGNPNWYVATLRLMTDPRNQPVLVHCGAGTERTGCAVVLYRHIVEGVPIDEAYTEAESFDHSARRNPKLRRVLDEYAGAIEAAYRQGGSIPGQEPVAAAPVVGAER